MQKKIEEKFFTMRIPSILHNIIKTHCASKSLSMKDFSYLSLLEGLPDNVRKKFYEEIGEPQG